MKYALYKYGIVFAVLGAVYVYWQYDRATNYEQV